ncbi:MAG: chemotaxis protein CheW [Patescibacteria group bacterium]|jgi:purine-binding chemotaxis protein CheW
MASKSEQFVLFYIGQEQYALPALTVNKFIEFKDLTLIPKVNKEVKGLIYNNGHIITIIDIKEILKIKSTKSNKQPMCLIFESSGHHYGLVVDQGGEITSVNKIFTDRQKKIFNKYFKTKDKKNIYILEANQIVSQIGL